MDSTRWEQIQALFHLAVARPESERRRFLETVCAQDPELLAEVARMLHAENQGASILDDGLPTLADQMMNASFDSASGREFGPYRLKQVLGEGGMGVVWLAERRDAGNLVAIKFLPHAGLSPARRDRFAREIKTLARLRHPYIARLYDAGALPDGTPWFVMEYVEGIHFIESCRQQKVSLPERLRLFRRVCEAVQYAHSQEIIHRDLKPSNILVEADGTPRLLDFGIARELQGVDQPLDQTRAGLRFWSPEYAAPEWIREGIVGFSTDVYSLGIILQEMLTGRRPGSAAQPSDPNGAPALPLAAQADLDVLCRKAAHPEPAERYQSVEALIRDIDHFLRQEPLEGRPDSLAYRLRKFVARNRRAVLAAALAFASIAALVVFFTLRLARERDHANRETALATSMNRFLSDDLLAQTDPFQSGKSQESFAEVVNLAASRIDTQFASEPLVAARLHQTVAKAFDNRSDFPRARREYVRAAALFGKAAGPLSPDAVLVNLQRAVMEARSYERGSLDLAKSLLARAQAALAKIPNPREELSVWLLYTRGVISLIGNDARSARENFSAALRRAQADPSFDAPARRRIQQTLAFSSIRLGDGEKAESLLRDLVDDYSRAGGPDSPNTLRARINLSQALLTAGKYAAALQETNRIYPALVNKLGEDHEATMTVLGTRAASEGSLGMWDEAIRDDLTVYRLGVRKQGPVSFFSIGMLSDAALSQCLAGRYAEGEPNARQAYQQASRAFGPRAGITGGCAYALSICLIGKNQLAEASRLLNDIDAASVSQLSGDSKVSASIALAQGHIAARQGNYALARRDAETAARAFDKSNAPFAEKRSLKELQTRLADHLPAAR